VTATWTSSCGTYNVSRTTGLITFRVVGVKRLQYLLPSTGQFVDVSGTLYALVGNSITFQAIPDPESVSFPAGQPMWDVNSVAAGMGPIVPIFFGVLSPTAADFQTVTATCGTSSQFADVVVFDLLPTLTPVDNFDGRDLDTFGVCEYIDLSCPIVPYGVTEDDVGGLQWYIDSGGGDLSGGAGGVGTYRCPDVAAVVVLKVAITAGAMFSKEKKAAPAPIVPPDGHFVEKVPMTGLWHEKDKVGCKWKANFYATCAKVVSFKEIEVREGKSKPAVGKGYFAGNDGDVHTPGGWGPLNALVAMKGYQWAGFDTTGFGGGPAPFMAGTYTQEIFMMYKDKNLPAANEGHQYATCTSTMESTAAGRATVTKGQGGPYSKNAADNSNLLFVDPDP
jgi:hypothetical protein